ncbi:MAG: Ig-like domain-containing protein [Pseudomonadota bacterium]
MTSLTQAAVLTPQAVFKNDFAGVAAPVPVVVSSDGQQVYVGSGSDAALAVFRRNAAGSYALLAADTYTAEETVGGGIGIKSLQSLAISPDGRHLYAGYARLSDMGAAIAVLPRDGSGALAAAVQTLPLAGSRLLGALTVSRDGAAVYAVGEGGLYVYGRDAQSGHLTLQQQLRDDVGGVDGLAGARAVAVSPDSRHVYVTGAGEQALAAFRRENGGQLTFLAVYRNGVNGVAGLGDARGVVVSPDGKHVYTAAVDDHAVSVFARDGASGLLQLNQVYRDGVQGIDGLGGAYALALSPEGSQLYVSGSAEDALTVFRRDGSSGALQLVQVLRQQPPGVDGLHLAIGLSVHPDGRQLFVTSPVDNSLAVFGIAVAGLNLVMQVDANTKTVGESAQFQLMVTNNGPATATRVVVEHRLPAGVGVASGGSSQTPCNQLGARLHCDIGDLPAGGRATVNISVNFPQAGTYLNDAVAAADQRDPLPSDNQDQETVQVNPINLPPVAEDDSAATRPGVAVDIPVLANDHDPDGDKLVISLPSAAAQQGGGLHINSDGSVHYVPAAGFHGLDSFSYSIADGKGGSAQARVRVTVNTPPDAKDDLASVTAASSAIIHVLVNDVDADGDTLNLVAAQTPSARGGSVSINGDGTVNYSAPVNFTGEDSFDYTVTDANEGSDNARVSVVVIAAVASGNSGGTPPAPQSQPEQPQSGGGGAQVLESLLLSLVLIAGHRHYPSRPCRARRRGVNFIFTKPLTKIQKI